MNDRWLVQMPNIESPAALSCPVSISDLESFEFAISFRIVQLEFDGAARFVVRSSDSGREVLLIRIERRGGREEITNNVDLVGPAGEEERDQLVVRPRSPDLRRGPEYLVRFGVFDERVFCSFTSSDVGAEVSQPAIAVPRVGSPLPGGVYTLSIEGIATKYFTVLELGAPQIAGGTPVPVNESGRARARSAFAQGDYERAADLYAVVANATSFDAIAAEFARRRVSRRLDSAWLIGALNAWSDCELLIEAAMR
ncbi:MAG: hypothetical protein AAF517_10760, partial [Planctomycetota bacterium]